MGRVCGREVAIGTMARDRGPEAPSATSRSDVLVARFLTPHRERGQAPMRRVPGRIHPRQRAAGDLARHGQPRAEAASGHGLTTFEQGHMRSDDAQDPRRSPCLVPGPPQCAQPEGIRRRKDAHRTPPFPHSRCRVVRLPREKEQILTRPPYIFIEVLSPDPVARHGWRIAAEGQLEARDGVLQTTDGHVAMPLADLFES